MMDYYHNRDVGDSLSSAAAMAATVSRERGERAWAYSVTRLLNRRLQAAQYHLLARL